MSRQEFSTELNKLLAILKAEVAQETAASFSDIKTALAEFILLDPVRAALQLPDLYSLNSAQKRNFPAIDLADDEDRTSIQLTSTSDVSKIRNTVSKFKSHQLYKKYDRLFVLLLSDKKNYRKDLSVLADGLFEFSNDNILDLNDLYKRLVETEDLSSLRNVVTNLRANLIGDSILDSIRDKPTQTEVIHLNLLPILLPETVYIGRLTLDEPAIRKINKSFDRPRKLRHPRDFVRVMLAHVGSDFPRDFICHDGLIISFRQLDHYNLESLGLIDEGTIEPIDIESFYSASLDNEIQFRFLLRTTLQTLLSPHNIFWQHEERMFAFGPNQEMDTRYENWIGKVQSRRKVFSKMESDSPNSRPVYKHFAFRAHFKLVDSNWFLIVEPKWLFSWDGYKKSFAHAKLASNTAIMERNQQIYSHTRFLSWFLSSENIESTIMKLDKNIAIHAETEYEHTEWDQVDDPA